LTQLKEESKESDLVISFDSIRPSGFLLWNMGIEVKNLHLFNKSNKNPFAFKELKADKARIIIAAWHKSVDVMLKNMSHDIILFDEFTKLTKLRYAKYMQQNEILIQTSYTDFTDVLYIYKDITNKEKLEFKNTENNVNFKFDNLYYTFSKQENFFEDDGKKELFAEYNLAKNGKPGFINILRNKNNDTIKIKTYGGDFKIKLNDKFAAQNEMEEIIVKSMSQMHGYPKFNADIDFSFDPSISQLYEEIKSNTINFDKISMFTKIHSLNLFYNDVGINIHGDLKLAENKAFTEMQIDFTDIDSIVKNSIQFLDYITTLDSKKDSASMVTESVVRYCFISSLSGIIKKHAPYDAETKTHQVKISLPSLPITNLKIMGQGTKAVDAEITQLLSSCNNGVIAEIDKKTEESK
jgi:hypothetical protein